MIKLNKDIYFPETDQTVTHWKVISIFHDHELEQVIYKLRGYASATARNTGLQPLEGAAGRQTFVARNPPLDENDDFIGIPYYNRWKNFSVDEARLLADPTLAKGLKFEREQALNFLSSLPELDGFVEE